MADVNNGFTHAENQTGTMMPPYLGNQQHVPPISEKGQPQPNEAPPPNAQPLSPYEQAMQAYEANVMIAQPCPQSVTIMEMGSGETMQRLTDLLGLSCVACLCCCMLVGICAIVVASSAIDAAARGDFVTANQRAKTARNLIIASVILGIISYVTIPLILVILHLI